MNKSAQFNIIVEDIRLYYELDALTSKPSLSKTYLDLCLCLAIGYWPSLYNWKEGWLASIPTEIGPIEATAIFSSDSESSKVVMKPVQVAALEAGLYLQSLSSENSTEQNHILKAFVRRCFGIVKKHKFHGWHFHLGSSGFKCN